MEKSPTREDPLLSQNNSANNSFTNAGFCQVGIFHHALSEQLNKPHKTFQIFNVANFNRTLCGPEWFPNSSKTKFLQIPIQSGECPRLALCAKFIENKMISFLMLVC